MTEGVTPENSRRLAKIPQRHTAPELAVRRCLNGLGVRFRLHRADLPGHPDVIVPKHRLAIFVHGCFWHRHAGCSRATLPKTRPEFWAEKFRANVERDQRKERALHILGWRVVTIWECETDKQDDLVDRLKRELASP